MTRPNALQVKVNGNWRYVIGKSRTCNGVVTSTNRSLAQPGRAQQYFEAAYNTLNFRVEA